MVKWQRNINITNCPHAWGTPSMRARTRRILHTFSDITLLLAYCAFRSLYFVLLSQQRAPRYKAVAWRFRSIRFSSHGYRSHLWIAQEERKSLEQCHGLTVFFPFTACTPSGNCFRAPRLLAAGRCVARRLFLSTMVGLAVK